jgi:hypothetical protein
MSKRLPPISVIEKIDPKLAERVREMHRMKRVPLATLKKAAMAYGKRADEVRSKGGGFLMLTPEAAALLAAAFGFYFWESRKKE